MILPFLALLYHKVTPNWEVGITWVTPQQFRSHIDAVRKMGWTFCPLPSNFSSPPNPSSLSLLFDDGYSELMQYAVPYLVEQEIVGHIFIPSGYIGKSNDWDHQLLGRRYSHLSFTQIKTLHKLGWRWGSHGLTHRPLTTLGAQTLKKELEESKKMIEDIIGDEVSWLSLPFGKHSSRVLEAAYRAGYTGIVIPEIPAYSYPESLNLLIPQFVYLWDSSLSLVRRLENISNRPILRRWLDRAVRLANWGTYCWGQIRVKRHTLHFFI